SIDAHRTMMSRPCRPHIHHPLFPIQRRRVARRPPAPPSCRIRQEPHEIPPIAVIEPVGPNFALAQGGFRFNRHVPERIAARWPLEAKLIGGPQRSSAGHPSSLKFDESSGPFGGTPFFGGSRNRVE